MTTKLWGMTEQVFRNRSVEVQRIEVKKGGYCSIHRHRHKSNQFYIESGKLRVTVFGEQGRPPEITTLDPGASLTVAAGAVHRFEALEDTVAFEIYAGHNVDPGDIVRYSEGGFTDG